MTLNRFTQTDGDGTTPTDDTRVFPRLTPVEDGAVDFRTRGIVGHFHYLEDENALAYGTEKHNFFYKFNGYAVSADILDELPDRAAALRDAGHVPADATLEYIFFFVPEEREILKFTLDQYTNAENEWENYEDWGRDLQYIVDEDKAVETWTDFSHVMKDPDRYHAYTHA